MKVLLVNHGTAAEWGGGDGVQIRETAKRLRQRGYRVEIQNGQPDVEFNDYIFNCRENSFISIKSKSWINIVYQYGLILAELFGARGTYAD